VTLARSSSQVNAMAKVPDLGRKQCFGSGCDRLIER